MDLSKEDTPKTGGTKEMEEGMPPKRGDRSDTQITHKSTSSVTWELQKGIWIKLAEPGKRGEFKTEPTVFGSCNTIYWGLNDSLDWNSIPFTILQYIYLETTIILFLIDQ